MRRSVETGGAVLGIVKHVLGYLVTVWLMKDSCAGWLMWWLVAFGQERLVSKSGSTVQ